MIMNPTHWSSLAILWLAATVYLAIYAHDGAGPWDGNLLASLSGLTAMLCVRSILAAVRAEIAAEMDRVRR